MEYLSASDWLNWLRLLGAAVVFIAPGWLISWLVPSGLPALGAFLASSAVAYLNVLLLDACGIPVTVTSLALITTLWSYVLYRLHPHFAMGPVDGPKSRPAPGKSIVPRWIWVPSVFFGLISVAARSLIDPLSGWDNIFRWDYLARLLLAHESLQHYPAVSAQAHYFYSWSDGIPPLISILHHWIYAGSGSVAPQLTSVIVLAEYSLTSLTIYRLGQTIWGNESGLTAVAAFNTSALCLWGFSMGQETGLLALTLVALVYYLYEYQARPSRACAIWAGISASVGAIARDYALAYILFGAVALLVLKARRSDLIAYASATLIIAAPWYIRNWAITGNPIYPHSLAGLFPSNQIHLKIMEAIAGHWSLGAGIYPLSVLGRQILYTAGVASLIGLAGFSLAPKKLWLVAGATMLSATLCVVSIPSTAGGWLYALRVLTPGICVLALGAGWLASKRASIQLAAAIIMLVASADAARRSWVLPLLANDDPLPYDFHQWRRLDDTLQSYHRSSVWQSLAERTHTNAIIVWHPNHHAYITTRGGKALSWFSPQAAPMFTPNASFEESVDDLIAANVRFVGLSHDDVMTGPLISAHPFLLRLTADHEPNEIVPFMRIFDLHLLQARTEPVNTSATAN